jgi:hypothetical protein
MHAAVCAICQQPGFNIYIQNESPSTYLSITPNADGTVKLRLVSKGDATQQIPLSLYENNGYKLLGTSDNSDASFTAYICLVLVDINCDSTVNDVLLTQYENILTPC